jgi:hypothetical protein
MDETAKKLEARLVCSIAMIEGAVARPIWNRQDCPYYDMCGKARSRDALRIVNEEKGKRTHCLYNPGMFHCSAYQSFAKQSY